ncbi:ribulose-phosphate 3-epimerase [Candidatus Latescibacterota bacterium]
MNKIKVSPSVLAADISCLGEEIARAEEGGCDDIHVDIMDGHFVPNLSFGPAIVSALKKMTDLPLDVHLMIDNPAVMIKPFADAGSDYLTIHVEVTDNVPKIIGEISDLGVKAGISLRPDTPVESVLPYLDSVDIVLVMSVFPGFGGQAFIEESYDRIARIAEAASELKSPPLISVDGGVVIDNAPNLVKSGANHLVAGTAVFGGHKAVENIRNMRAAIGE